MCVFLNQNTLEEIMVMLKDRPLKEASFILKKLKNLMCLKTFIKNFQIFLFNISIPDKKPSSALLMRGYKKSPFFQHKTKALLINGACNYDKLVNGLEKINFIQKKDFPFDTPGSFYINGGVIDVKPFDTKENYRISFLESDCKVYTVNKDTNTIVFKFKAFSFSKKL